MFCPECGESLTQRSEDSTAPAVADEAARAGEPTTEPETLEPKAATEPIADKTPAALSGDKDPPGPAKHLSTTTPDKGRQTQAAAPSVKTIGGAIPGQERTGVKAREKLHRASTAARGAIEGNVKRVERIRQVSSVVLEEAHYDPSLRFVLVAVVLFVIVAVLLVLSKVMG